MFGKFFLISFMLVSGASLYAQHRTSENVKPKGPLKPFTIYMMAVADTGVQRPVYFYDVMKDTVWDGHKATKRETATTMPGEKKYVRWATVVFDAKTLLPYFSEYRRLDGIFLQHIFDGLHVTEIKNCDDILTTPRRAEGARPDTITTQSDLKGPAYTWLENSGLPVLLSLPLQPGFQGSVPVISGDSLTMRPWTHGPSYILPMTYRVTAKERIKGLSGKTVWAWKVWIPETKFWFWISCKNPRLEGVTWPSLNGNVRFTMKRVEEKS